MTIHRGPFGFGFNCQVIGVRPPADAAPEPVVEAKPVPHNSPKFSRMFSRSKSAAKKEKHETSGNNLLDHPSPLLRLSSSEAIRIEWKVFVRSVAAAGAAESAGLKPGDHIISVNGNYLAGKTLEMSNQLIVGTPGDLILTVRYLILRP